MPAHSLPKYWSENVTVSSFLKFSVSDKYAVGFTKIDKSYIPTNLVFGITNVARLLPGIVLAEDALAANITNTSFALSGI